ncbi:PEGA domain-containing protein [Vibrio atypicus]|jgi:hypothetical protein|uniref:PEGA domain-containing protein n=1 Tax=Vibrio atypicus TaxID=558271 RepID=UPI00135A20F6|nr:PEGA domain-containing protein [Vibrio atypicus]
MNKRRIPALLLALAPFWVSTSTFAEESASSDPVTAIESKIKHKESELDSVSTEYSLEAEQLLQLQNEQSRLQRSEQELINKRDRAKTALDTQYTRLLEDPEIDLASYQTEYRQSWAAVKETQKSLLENKQAISENEMRVSNVKQKQARLKSEFSYLKEQKVDARVKRLDRELRDSSVLETSYTTTCSATMTLGECSNQGQYLTKQKAVKIFKSQLLDSLTEAHVAKQFAKDVQLNVIVQESQVVRSSFEGTNQYFTQIQAQLRARPDKTTACKLLNVSNRYCLKSAKKNSNKKVDKSWVNVTVRSDQYDDAVTINGISYGSTPVEVVLPKGQHQVTVSKNGYQSYNRIITINSNDTVWVKLRPNG